MAIGKQIRHYREKLGWKLEKLSALSNVDVGTISALELRDSSRSKYFPQISKAFGLTLEELGDESVDHDVSRTNADVTPFKTGHPATGSPTSYEWPFRTLTPDQYWNVLTQEHRNIIEATAISFANSESRDRPSKQSTPATTYITKTA